MKKRILQREFGSPSQLRSAYLGGASEREEEEEADREQRRHWLALGHVLERLMHGRPIETTRIEAV